MGPQGSRISHPLAAGRATNLLISYQTGLPGGPIRPAGFCPSLDLPLMGGHGTLRTRSPSPLRGVGSASRRVPAELRSSLQRRSVCCRCQQLVDPNNKRLTRISSDGTDEDAIIDVLTKLNVSQRQQVLITYKSTIGRDLIDDLKSELSGNFERVIIGMMTPTTMYDVHELRRAVKGAGTDEGCLIEILASRTNGEIRRINENYKLRKQSKRPGLVLLSDSHFVGVQADVRRQESGELLGVTQRPSWVLLFAQREARLEFHQQLNAVGSSRGVALLLTDAVRVFLLEYGCSLEDDIVSDTSSMLRRVLVSLATGNRDEGMRVDDALAQQDAQCLYEAGEKKWGTDEVQFMSILCTRNRYHLLRVFDVYRGIANKDITDSIKSEMSGDLEDALLAVVKCMRNKPAYFAERLYKSMKGLGTDDNTLIRVMVSRSEIDMLDIRREFLTMYGKSLYSFIKGDCSGDYRKVLLKLCGGED